MTTKWECARRHARQYAHGTHLPHACMACTHGSVHWPLRCYSLVLCAKRGGLSPHVYVATMGPYAQFDEIQKSRSSGQ